MSTAVHDNPQRHRFEISEGGQVVGLLVYRERGTTFDLVHTEVQPAHQGHGLATTLIQETLDELRRRGATALPTCPAVAHFLTTHPSYLDLVPVDRRAELAP